ncbi:MAG: hypothetical protein ABJ004_13330 [Cyclobacteriaceae bacterium]
MKKLILVYVPLFLTVLSSTAQGPDFSKEVKAKVADFDFMIGTWKGTGEMMMPGGSSTSNVTEVISYKAGETAIQMEGLGTITLPSGEKQVVHDALGVLSYDFFKKQYKLYTFISKGMQTQADIELKGEGHAVWWIKAGPQGTIRYTIKVVDGKWNEIGERSQDGENWTKFFEMNLVKE